MKVNPFEWRTSRLRLSRRTVSVLRFAVFGACLMLVWLGAGTLWLPGPDVRTGTIGLGLAYGLILLPLVWRLNSSARSSLAEDQRGTNGPPAVEPDSPSTFQKEFGLFIAWDSSPRALFGHVAARTFAFVLASLVSILAIVFIARDIGGPASATAGASGRGPAPAGGRPQTVTRTFTVVSTAGPADLGGGGWLNTGIVLKAGLPVSITATGLVSCASNYSWCTVGPAGDSSAYTGGGSGFPVSDAPAWGLMAQVGGGAPQFAGAHATISGAGILMLGVNDNYLEDNGGSFKVAVMFVCDARGDPPERTC